MEQGTVFQLRHGRSAALASFAGGSDAARMNDHAAIAEARARKAARRTKTVKARIVPGKGTSRFGEYVVAGGFGCLLRRPRNYEVTVMDDLMTAAERIHAAVAEDWPRRAAYWDGTTYGIVCVHKGTEEVRHD